jgi:heme/copper-type cytochrome/quinol oxidase subunit 3
MSKLQHSKKYTRHPFHIVDPSPWPFIGAFSALFLTLNITFLLHGYTKLAGIHGCWNCFYGVLFSMYMWWRNIVHEATFEGQHTKEVQQGLKIGIILFIISEIMFFFGFFWAFFDASISPKYAIGGVWPPNGLQPINPWGIPLLNTLLLLTSGATLTLSHHTLLMNKKTFIPLHFLILTIFLGILFMFLQVFEYKTAPFSITDGIYGSLFFLLTGFHGLHVMIGIIFLIVCAKRMEKEHFTSKHHLGFEAAAYYWHFVDVVWLFLFISLYWWGS